MRRLTVAFLFLLFCGCAGLNRECSSCCAGSLGADWVVVQMDGFGRVMRCWELRSVSISNEKNSDGIYWKSEDGHLVHISGFYNRVQVEGGGWDQAYRELGLRRELCESFKDRVLETSCEKGIESGK